VDGKKDVRFDDFASFVISIQVFRLDRQPEKNRMYPTYRTKGGRKEIFHTRGGDIGFPILLTSSVYFAHGLNDGLIVAGFALVGLVSAYFIQAKFLKGNAMPALRRLR